MSKRQLEELMWADACAAMERAERLRRQFFHHGASHWEAPIDVFETDDALTILIALPGVELDSIKVTLSAGTLIDHAASGRCRRNCSMRASCGWKSPTAISSAGSTCRRCRSEISGRHLANGCLMLRLRKDHGDDARNEQQMPHRDRPPAAGSRRPLSCPAAPRSA